MSTYPMEELSPDLEQARRNSSMAHQVVIKLKEAGLPEDFDEDLASLSTDLGDLWGAQKALAERLEAFVRSPHDWETLGDYLMDLKASIDHIAWHLSSVQRPLDRIARFAYETALGQQEK